MWTSLPFIVSFELADRAHKCPLGEKKSFFFTSDFNFNRLSVNFNQTNSIEQCSYLREKYRIAIFHKE